MDGGAPMLTDARAPFPYFGGKRSVAPLAWDAFGRVSNYVEPFFGSGAVLLARPRETWASPSGPGTETVNDASRFLSNFWRALKSDPDAVTEHADFPVSETDLHARHRWLVDQLPRLAALLDSDPGAFDAKVAGWWVWGACSWIGGGWCDEERAARVADPAPAPGQCGAGPAPLPIQLPHPGNAGQGLHRKLPTQLPHLGGNHDSGRGIHSKGHRADLRAYLGALSERLRGVRIACGDWSRVTGDSVTWRHGITAVFLDPPYLDGNVQYAAGGAGTSLSADVRAWALKAGERRDMRVILCGYEGEHAMPSTWRVVEWKARGGYASRGGENVNARRERLWLSPACLGARQPSLFGGGS